MPLENVGTGALQRRRDAAARRRQTARRNSARAARHRSAAEADLTRVHVFELGVEDSIPEVAARYEAAPHVEYAHPDYRYRALAEPLPAVPVIPNDPFVEDPARAGFWREGSWGLAVPDLWGLARIRTLEAWNLLANPLADAGRGVVVAVVDSGIDHLHPDIAANVWINADEARQRDR
jgi:hypothetical protein